MKIKTSMKTYIINLFLLPALIAGLGLIPAGRVTAQTFTNLHSFTLLNNSTNSDGARPYAGLILSGNTLYGTAVQGGNSGNGTVFAVHTNGTGFTNLHSFTAAPGPLYTNSDGANPYAGLILSGNTLYGTAYGGGSSGDGTVFAVNVNGAGFTNLHSFTATSGSLYTNSDGADPYAGLILSGNTLYGTAFYGGNSGNGTVFAVNTNGTGFTNLHSFTATSGSLYTNSDGANPYAGLILSGNTLYGTAYQGGSSGKGTVFAVNTNGTGFTNLHSFTATRTNSSGVYTNSDGATPFGGLILSGNTLYGTAIYGGSSSYGTVFAVHTNGTGFTNLHSFTFGSDGATPFGGLILSGNTLYGTAIYGGSSSYGTVFAVHTNGTGFTNLHSFTFGSDGAYPRAGLILSGNTLYGTAANGGSSSAGMVFAVNADGTGFANLYSFTTLNNSTNSDGAEPEAGLILSGNTLYGTATYGGSSGYGTVFSLFIPPQLTIIPSGANVILTWPTNAAGFTLQSTTNLVSPAVWSTVSPAPVVVNGQNAVTNPISGTQKFYRLSQ
jgi:uncharacterized repeat protein (TIGR03803 family)